MRARLAALALTMTLATLAGCGDAGDTSGAETSTAPVTTEETVAAPDASAEDTAATGADSSTGEAPVTVEATASMGNPTLPGVEPSTRGLAVHYTVRNTGDEPLLVARERGHTQDSSAVGPRNDESVWVRVEDGVLVLSKELMPLLDGHEEERETTLGADVLEPGESLDGTAFVLRPVEVTFPRAEDKGDLVDPLPERWRLCLTVAPVDRRTDVIGRLDQGQELVCSEPAILPDGLALR